MTLKKVVSNVAMAPTEAKYKKLKLSNPKINELLVQGGALPPLLDLGWVQVCASASSTPPCGRSVDQAEQILRYILRTFSSTPGLTSCRRRRRVCRCSCFRRGNSTRCPKFGLLKAQSRGATAPPRELRDARVSLGRHCSCCAIVSLRQLEPNAPLSRGDNPRPRWQAGGEEEGGGPRRRREEEAARPGEGGHSSADGERQARGRPQTSHSAQMCSRKTGGCAPRGRARRDAR